MVTHNAVRRNNLLWAQLRWEEETMPLSTRDVACQHRSFTLCPTLTLLQRVYSYLRLIMKHLTLTLYKTFTLRRKYFRLIIHINLLTLILYIMLIRRLFITHPRALTSHKVYTLYKTYILHQTLIHHTTLPSAKNVSFTEFVIPFDTCILQQCEHIHTLRKMD